MNHFLVALALVSSMQRSPPDPRAAASQAAVQAFNEACVQGQFRLTPDRGRILKKGDEPGFADVLSSWEPTQYITIELNYPPRTYLVSANFGNLQPHSLVSQCMLISGSITKHDAMAALMATAPGVLPVIAYIPDMYLPEWTIDLPKKGYRSRMYIREGGSIVLEVGMYKTPAQQPATKP